MTRDGIIRMAREAATEDGSVERDDGKNIVLYAAKTNKFLERFYHLAYAAGEQAERDRTKRLVEDMQNELYQRRMAGRNT